MTEGLTIVEAVRTALARAMSEDETVIVLGEDVGVDGGVFRATDGLLDRFGPDRVIDTPISESLFVGLGVGMAARGSVRSSSTSSWASCTPPSTSSRTMRAGCGPAHAVG